MNHSSVRTWLVTALDNEGKFIDQRIIKGYSNGTAEGYAFDWIRRVGGNVYKSIIKEVYP